MVYYVLYGNFVIDFLFLHLFINNTEGEQLTSELTTTKLIEKTNKKIKSMEQLREQWIFSFENDSINIV